MHNKIAPSRGANQDIHNCQDWCQKTFRTQGSARVTVWYLSNRHSCSTYSCQPLQSTMHHIGEIKIELIFQEMISFLKYLLSEIKANKSSFNHPVSTRLLPMTSIGFGHVSKYAFRIFAQRFYRHNRSWNNLLLCRTRPLLTYFFPKPVPS